MKKRVHKFLICSLLTLITSLPVVAQYMPVVFDKKYGEKNKIELVSSLVADEIAMVGKEGNHYNLTWTDREGEVVFSMPLTGFTAVNQLTEVEGGGVLIVGQSSYVEKKKRKDLTLCGRALVVNRNGQVVTNIYAGVQGTNLLKGQMLRSGDFILSGTEPKATMGRQGLIMKVDATGHVMYTYRNIDSGYCDQFVVFGNSIEYVCAAFSADKGKEKAAIVRLDDKGKPYYVTIIPANRFVITELAPSMNDGSVVLIGHSPVEGGIVYKLRPEGDIVFAKTLVPLAQEGAKLTHLYMARNGNILVGGTGSKAYYAVLRNDGTALYNGVSNGMVRGVGMNPITGESIVTTYDINTRRGTFVRINSNGRTEFEKTLDGDFDKIKIANNGEILLLSSTEGRVSMYSSMGEKEFDRHITNNKATKYKQSITVPSGEVIFVDAGSRIVKLGHGLYVSDVKMTKPVNGTATAVFTVTLTGYATTKEGAPIPVSVNYETREVSASVTDNFTPVKGKLSFTPSRGTADRYLVKQDIEVPVKANAFIEGTKEFELVLAEVRQSYLVKPVGTAVIEDQPSVIKLVRTEKGIEGAKDIVYELGLFKTDGTPLTNATGANIIVDGAYGEGTADALDFDLGFTPRVIFENHAHKATFSVKTLEDTRYELPKTVVVNFNRVHNLSGCNIGFEGELLSCSGTVEDQPAMLAITSLGDHRLNNNVVSGFFTLSVLRASDGALQTNNTGSDIMVNCAVLPDASAKEGKDFVFTNLHDLRISGDGNHSSANVNGVVLYTTDALEKQVKLKINSVKQPTGAQPIAVSPAENAAEFMIKK